MSEGDSLSVRMIGQIERVIIEGGIDQQTFARMASLTPAHVNRLFRGHQLPSLTTLELMADTLGCTWYVELIPPPDGLPQPPLETLSPKAARTRELANRIKSGIDRRGLTVAAFAREVGMDPTALAKCLGGLRIFKPGEMARIGEFFLLHDPSEGSS